MQTFLLSIIAGMLAFNFINENLDPHDNVPVEIAIYAAYVLITSAIVLALVYGLKITFGILNISF